MSELGRGDLVDRYIVLDLIGRGGMGVVLAAYDPDLDRKVALKLLHPGLFADPSEAQLRLQREAQAMARLSHPNVVSVHDVGTVGDAMFIAMEFVDGTLADWLAQRRSWRDIVSLFLQAGRGLVAAHGSGIVHRDFKPANVLIDRQGQARVTDFGIASLGDPMGEKDLATGTPAYMAPEQHLKKPTDARSDQFAFCVALYEALYGRRPFRGDTLEELAFRVTCQKPDPPPDDHEVPRWVWHVLETGLHTKSEHRHASMRDLLLGLEHDPEAATRRGAVIRALIEFGRARTEEGDIATAETVLRDALADAMSAGDARLIAAAEVALAHVVGLACGRREEADERLASAERQLIEAGGDALIDARLHHLRGALCTARQRYDEAVDEFRAAAELFEKALGPATTKLAELAAHTGVAVQRAGRPEEAIEHYQRAHELAQRARGSHSLESATALDGWATALQTLGRYREARALFQEALEMRTRLLGPSNHWVGESHSNLGQLMLVLNELEDAAPHLEAALAIAEQTHGPTSTFTASSLNNLGSLMVSRGQWQEGLSYLERALAVAEHVFGRDSYETSIPLSNLAWELMKSGRAPEALAKFERALELLRAA
ncbi:MAG TPA: serine/threonine-protein kinase, partial [Polyangiaceae bacterium]|nr:serine/threonine-protein kinase [Polyangiaceae bacterium]